MPAEHPADVKFEIGHVLFIDIVGYSKLLINEQSEQIRKLREILRGTEQFRLAEAEGKLLRLPAGDGGALVFRNSPEAPVLCAVEISKELKNHPELRIRMGIHSGPVNEVTDLNEQANIAGAGINIAQRVMDCGDAGHILLSKRVADDLEHYPQWRSRLHELGECEVKHGLTVSIVNVFDDQIGNAAVPSRLRSRTAVVEPSRDGEKISRLTGRPILLLFVAALILLAGLYWITTKASLRKAAPEQKSIAVLPFENRSGDAETEYLADGIPEALINSLTELQQLKVIARSTAFRYKDKDLGPEEVGRQLKVRAVLMGVVRQTGQRLDVQVDLVDTSTGAQLWGEKYERTVSEIVAIKQTIVREVTEKLKLRLSGEQQQRLVRRDTTNAEAYQFYLRGRHYWNKRTAEGIRKAIEEFQHAIDRDPNYALGYVGLADCYLLLEQYAGAPASESLPKARAAIDRALQLDDSLAEAHTSSAYIYQGSWRWADAEREFRHAISLNPNYPTAHHWFAYYFYVKRQFDDAMKEIRRAQELDPLSPIIGENVALVYLLKNDFNSAVEQCQRVISFDQSFADAHYILGFAYLKQGRNQEATAKLQKALELSGRASTYLSDLGYCYAIIGRHAEALALSKELEEKYARRESTGQFVAGVYAGLGDRDQAFTWLEKDFQQRSGQLPTITWRLNFEGLHSDPRYADLVRRMNLEP